MLGTAVARSLANSCSQSVVGVGQHLRKHDLEKEGAVEWPLDSAKVVCESAGNGEQGDMLAGNGYARMRLSPWRP